MHKNRPFIFWATGLAYCTWGDWVQGLKYIPENSDTEIVEKDEKEPEEFISNILETPRIKIDFFAEHREYMRWISELPYSKKLYTGANVFIRSAMGTGKTTLILKWINEHFQNKKILYLSTWKTFTQSILTKLKEYDFVSY